MTALTRAVTYSHFDHVAIVLRFFEQPKELFYLEAVSTGVQIKRWSNLRNLIGPNQHYAQLVYRHVHFDRTQVFSKMEKFLEKSVGKKYEVNLSKFMKHKSTFNGIADDRTFFCSELVAKAFKLLGIMEDDGTSCAQFYPGHFAAAGDKFLKLKPGVIIENEMQVVVRQEELAKEANLIKH